MATIRQTRRTERRPRGPIIPADKADRTGALPLIRRAWRSIDARFAELSKQVRARFERIPVYKVNRAATLPETLRLLYGITPDQLAQLSEDLRAIVERWLLEGAPGGLLWWDEFNAAAALQGSAQSAANLAGLSAAYESSRRIADIINSDAYKTRIAVARFKSYEHWTGLAQDTRKTLADVIGRAIVDGKSVREASREIAQAVGVTRAKARQYAQTDLTDTLRQARLAEGDEARKRYGLRLGNLWTSALLPTTRAHHAARHGRVYSSDEVREFYATGGNVYRCHCSVTEALLDEAGRPVLSDRVEGLLAGEKTAWDKARAAEKSSP